MPPGGESERTLLQLNAEPSWRPLRGLSFSLSLILSSSSFWSSPRRLLFHFSLQPLAPFFGRVACSLPCERTSCSGVYTRAYTTLLSILPYQTDARAFIFSRTVAPRSTRIRTKNNSKSNSKWPVSFSPICIDIPESFFFIVIKFRNVNADKDPVQF